MSGYKNRFLWWCFGLKASPRAAGRSQLRIKEGWRAETNICYFTHVTVTWLPCRCNWQQWLQETDSWREWGIFFDVLIKAANYAASSHLKNMLSRVWTTLNGDFLWMEGINRHICFVFYVWAATSENLASVHFLTGGVSVKNIMSWKRPLSLYLYFFLIHFIHSWNGNTK